MKWELLGILNRFDISETGEIMKNLIRERSKFKKSIVILLTMCLVMSAFFIPQAINNNVYAEEEATEYERPLLEEVYEVESEHPYTKQIQ